MKKVIRYILATLLALLPTGYFFMTGNLLRQDLNIAPTSILGAGIALLAVLLLLALANLIISAKLLKQINKKSVREVRDLVTGKKLTDEPSLMRQRRHINSAIVWTYIYFFLMLAMSPATAILGGLLSRTPLGWVLAVLSFYILFSYTFTLLQEREHPQVFGLLRSKDYPALYGMLNRVRKKLGCRRRIALCSDGQFGASAFYQRNLSSYFINLGAALLPLLTDEELENMLIHEVAHIRYGDVRHTETLAFLRSILCGALEAVAPFGVYFRLPTALILWCGSIDVAISSEISERRADRAILQYGNPSVYTGLLAKLGCKDLFDVETERWLPEPEYLPKEPRQHPILRFAEAFRRAVSERLPFWRTLLDQELPPLMDSHPTFRERRESLGNHPYDVVFPAASADDPISAELRRITETVEEGSRPDSPEEYAAAREEYYLKPKRLVDEWEAAGEPLWEPDRMIPVIEAYMRLIRFDRAEAICDRMLSELPDDFGLTYARYIKGRILLDRWDPAGIALIDRALDDNNNYTDEGLQTIIVFCRWMNLPDELTAHREKLMDKSQHSIDVNDRFNSLTPKDRLSAETLPDGRLEEILNFIHGIDTGNAISDIWLVRKTVTDDAFTSAFVVRFRDDTEDEVLNDIMNQIFRHLDNDPSGWQYSLFLYEPAFDRFLNSIPCRVYPR